MIPLARQQRFILIALMLLVTLTACAAPTPGSPTAPPSPSSGSAAPHPRYVVAKKMLLKPDKDAVAYVPDLVQGINAFAADFYRSVGRDNQENVVFSPYSINLAFSLAYAGARGETASQMQEVLHFLPQEAHHPAWGMLNKYMHQFEEETDASGALRLHIINSAWVQEGYPLYDTYVNTLGRYYGIGLWLVDFIRDSEGARRAINDWAAKETSGKVQDIIPPNILNQRTRLVLVNAMHFKGLWAHPFTSTREEPFTLVDGTRVSVSMMHVDKFFSYVEGDDYQAVILPYVLGRRVSPILQAPEPDVDMIVILPARGRQAAVEEALSPRFLQEIQDRAEKALVHLGLPRFRMSFKRPLKQVLQNMGMDIPFDPGRADFTGISPDAKVNPLFIRDAFHQAFIDVNRKGTEAAAVTAVVVELEAGPHIEKEVTMTVDRPFLFAIVERHTGVVLFLGRVMDPR